MHVNAIGSTRVGSTRAHEEFERQVGVLLARGYPAAAGLQPRAFAARIEPLRERLGDLDGAGAAAGEPIPFVLVVGRELVPEGRAIELVERQGRSGVSVLEPAELARFAPIAGVTVPGRRI